MTSYTELLKKQLLVQASDFFGVSVESFESKLKNPNSIESKAIAVFTSIIASKQLAEKLIAEAIAFIHQTEEKLGMNARRRSATPHDSQFSEQKEESNANNNSWQRTC